MKTDAQSRVYAWRVGADQLKQDLAVEILADHRVLGGGHAFVLGLAAPWLWARAERRLGRIAQLFR